jgi:hypothetical protein
VINVGVSKQSDGERNNSTSEGSDPAGNTNGSLTIF